VNDDPLMTAAEVAEMLSVEVSWVRSASREGTIPTVPLGRWRRYRRSSVLAWIEQCEQPGRPVRLRTGAARETTQV
jgi:excisionase family DNA binding protein